MSAHPWPTPLAADGTAPPVKELLESGDLMLTRQTGYLLEVARRLQQLGHEVDTFQRPLEDVVVPLVTRIPGRGPQLIFTWSETWDDAAVAALAAWVAALRAAGRGAGVTRPIPIAVASNTECEAVAAMEDVMFLPVTVRGLPGDEPETEADAAPPEPGSPEAARHLADRFARMVHQQMGITLEFTPESLAQVDAAVDAVRASGVPEDQAAGALWAAGCFVGEVLVRCESGSWCTPGELDLALPDGASLVVRLATGVGADPVGTMFDRFRAGSAAGAVRLHELVTTGP